MPVDEAVYDELRPRAFAIAYRMLGSVSEAEDIVQEALVRVHRAIERGEPGVYNVVDDDPAPVREWLPVLASALGAKPPRRVPRWLGRLAGGETMAIMMTDVRGASNVKAKRELDWQLRYPSWRLGFTKGLV